MLAYRAILAYRPIPHFRNFAFEQTSFKHLFFLFAYLVKTCFLVCLSNNISSLVRSLVSSFRFGSVGVCCCSIYKILFCRNLCLFSPMLCCYCFCCCCEKEISFCRLFVHISHLFFLSLSCIILD